MNRLITKATDAISLNCVHPDVVRRNYVVRYIPEKSCVHTFSGVVQRTVLDNSALGALTMP